MTLLLSTATSLLLDQALTDENEDIEISEIYEKLSVKNNYGDQNSQRKHGNDTTQTVHSPVSVNGSNTAQPAHNPLKLN
uniref:Uncharacterized protein n=1 Tax=Timema poppense TaxID=170557 RepID=A0A7R9D5I0_TIMPO|nr:unnamed protein product [Timema poppensis]